jgi:biotin carboxylase
MSDKPTMLLLASYLKGADFIAESKKQGCRILLVTLEALKDRDWPRDSIDEFFYMPSFEDRKNLIHGIAYMARSRKIDRIVPMDDYDVELAAMLREHLRVPGMGDTTARFFRDKLAMRTQAQDEKVPVPAFVPVLNYDEIRAFMSRVPGPWMLKPRSEAAAVGIKKIHNPDELWPVLDQLGDRQSYFVLEQYVKGQVYHVDAITSEKEILFAEFHRYGAPPFDVAHHGGLFTSRTLPRDSKEAQDLNKVHTDVIKALRFVRGVTHSEFIRSDADGKFYFLETAARVGGAHLADVVDAATGVNLWREWAKIEIAGSDGSYRLPERRRDYAGIVLSLARQEWPDTRAYSDPEVVHHVKMKHHAGLIVRAPEPKRVEQLLESYQKRFYQDFYASAPPLDKPAT